MKLTERFSKAVAYAVALHADQCRKVSGAPYIGHLLRVAGIVLDHGADEDEAIAALLHDAVEDQGGPAMAEQILRRFGPRVAEIVAECSDTDQTPKPPWRARKERYLAHLATASPSARLVSAADKLDNARSLRRDYRRLGESLWEHFRGGREGTLWYFRAVTEALQRAGGGPLVEQLARTVSELEKEMCPNIDNMD